MGRFGRRKACFAGKHGSGSTLGPVSDPAYAHYTVERETSDKPADPRKTFVQALRWGWRGSLRRLLRGRGRGAVIDPQVALDVTDVVRVIDRSGSAVLTETFDGHARSEARRNQITSDLLSLDVDRFRKKYRIRWDDPGQR